MQAVLRRSPELRGAPVALTEAPLGRTGRPGRALVALASAEARRAGVRVGLTAAQAAAVCPGLTLCPRQAADTAAAAAALGDLGFGVASPVLRVPGRVFFLLVVLGSLYPSAVALALFFELRALLDH